MDAIQKRVDVNTPKLPNWYVQNGDYQFTCTCGRTTVIPFDRIDITGYVKLGLACNGCAKHRFIVLWGLSDRENSDDTEET